MCKSSKYSKQKIKSLYLVERKWNKNGEVRQRSKSLIRPTQIWAQGEERNASRYLLSARKERSCSRLSRDSSRSSLFHSCSPLGVSSSSTWLRSVAWSWWVSKKHEWRLKPNVDIGSRIVPFCRLNQNWLPVESHSVIQETREDY